jgi:hypothetical protein
MSKWAQYSTLCFLFLLTRSTSAVSLQDARLPPPPLGAPLPCKAAYTEAIPNCSESDFTNGCTSKCVEGITTNFDEYALQCAGPRATRIFSSWTTRALGFVCANGFIDDATSAMETTNATPSTQVQVSSPPVRSTKAPENISSKSVQILPTPGLPPQTPSISQPPLQPGSPPNAPLFTLGTPLVQATPAPQPQATSPIPLSEPSGIFPPLSPLAPPPPRVVPFPMITPSASGTPYYTSIATIALNSAASASSAYVPDPVSATSDPTSAESAINTSSSTSVAGFMGAVATNPQLAAVVGGVLGGCALIAIISSTVFYLLIKKLRKRRLGRSQSYTSSWGQLDPEMTLGNSPPPRFSDIYFSVLRSPPRTVVLSRNNSSRSYRNRGSALRRNNSNMSERSMAISRQNSYASRYNNDVPDSDYQEAEWNQLNGRARSLRRWPSARTVPTIEEENRNYRSSSVYEMPAPSPLPPLPPLPSLPQRPVRPGFL